VGLEQTCSTQNIREPHLTGVHCYWARLDGQQNLLDNHFGNAGGTTK
jgi:hypothetical protein